MVCIGVDPDWLNGNAGGFQAHNYGVEVHHGKCQVPQPCRLWIRRPRHWGREGEQFQLGESDPQVGLPRLPLLPIDLANQVQAEELDIEPSRPIVVGADERDVVNSVQHVSNSSQAGLWGQGHHFVDVVAARVASSLRIFILAESA